MIDFTLAELLTGLDLSEEDTVTPKPVSPPDDIDLSSVEKPKAPTDKPER